MGEVVTQELGLGGDVLRKLLLHHRRDQPVELHAAAPQERLVRGIADQRVPELVAPALDRVALLDDAGRSEPPYGGKPPSSVRAILRKVQDASEPISGPIGHPVLVAVVLLALLCLGIGLLVRTAAGRVTRRVL